MDTSKSVMPYSVGLKEYLMLPDELNSNNTRTNSFSILMDVFGEAERAVNMEGKDKDKILKQLRVLHDVCNIMYSSDMFNQYIKSELKQSEWELCDYLVGSNEYGYGAEGVMDWFNQWCYSINYDMLE